jgi:hypothetical protein
MPSSCLKQLDALKDIWSSENSHLAIQVHMHPMLIQHLQKATKQGALRWQTSQLPKASQVMALAASDHDGSPAPVAHDNS